MLSAHNELVQLCAIQVTVVVKRYLDCITDRYITYQATSTEPLSAVFDSGRSSYGVAETIRVVNIVSGRHVEMLLQHIGTLVVLRKYGRHFSVAVRTPTKIATAFSGGLDVQLCTMRCPVAERLSLKDVTQSASVSIERATAVCQQQGLVDFFLDACVFDFVATGGDRNFSLAAVHALRDYRRLNRNAAKQLHNRTTIDDSSHVRSVAPGRVVTATLYLVMSCTSIISILHCKLPYAACTL